VVDKVDRPDPVKKYDILPTKETHDEGQRRQNEQQDERRAEEEDEFSTPGVETSWNKFRTATPRQQMVAIQRNDVRQAVFRQAILQHRSAILEVDLILVNGSTFSRAQITSSNMDDYWKWKGWVPGQVISLDLMVQGPVLQVAVPLPGGSARPTGDTTHSSRITPLPERRRRRYIWQDAEGNDINWLWVVKVGAAIIVAAWVIGKLARWW
jgi:hypothetical protein